MKPTSSNVKAAEVKSLVNRYESSESNTSEINPVADNLILNQNKLLVLRNKLTSTWI